MTTDIRRACGRRRLHAADALHPLHLDLARLRVQQVLAFRDHRRAQHVEQRVGLPLVLVVRSPARARRPGAPRGSTAMSAGTYFSRPLFTPMSVMPMMKDEASTPRNRPICWAEGVAPDQEARLQVLGGVAGVGGRDADRAADHQSQHPVGAARPAHGQEHAAGGHQGRDGHARDGVGRGADEPDDAGTTRSRTGTRRSRPAARPAGSRTCRWGRPATGLEGEHRPHERDDHDRPAEHDRHLEVARGAADGRLACPPSASAGRRHPR